MSKAMSSSPVSVDASHLQNLARGLGDLRGETVERITRSAFKDAGNAAQAEASRRIIAAGNYGKAGKAGVIKKGMSFRQPASMQGYIQQTNGWFSLVPWADNKDSSADYTSKGLRGVRVSDHFSPVEFYKKGGRLAMIRAGGSGNVHVMARTGKPRKPLFAMRAVNPAHVLHHYEVHDPVVQHFNTKMEERYKSKYEYEVGKVKGKYGL